MCACARFGAAGRWRRQPLGGDDGTLAFAIFFANLGTITFGPILAQDLQAEAMTLHIVNVDGRAGENLKGGQFLIASRD